MDWVILSVKMQTMQRTVFKRFQMLPQKVSPIKISIFPYFSHKRSTQCLVPRFLARKFLDFWLFCQDLGNYYLQSTKDFERFLKIGEKNARKPRSWQEIQDYPRLSKIINKGFRKNLFELQSYSNFWTPWVLWDLLNMENLLNMEYCLRIISSLG